MSILNETSYAPVNGPRVRHAVSSIERAQHLGNAISTASRFDVFILFGGKLLISLSEAVQFHSVLFLLASIFQLLIRHAFNFDLAVGSL